MKTTLFFTAFSLSLSLNVHAKTLLNCLDINLLSKPEKSQCITQSGYIFERYIDDKGEKGIIDLSSDGRIWYDTLYSKIPSKMRSAHTNIHHIPTHAEAEKICSLRGKLLPTAHTEYNYYQNKSDYDLAIQRGLYEIYKDMLQYNLLGGPFKADSRYSYFSAGQVVGSDCSHEDFSELIWSKATLYSLNNTKGPILEVQTKSANTCYVGVMAGGITSTFAPQVRAAVRCIKRK